MRALLTLLTATAALGLADSAGAATVAKVIDGDTVTLKDGRTVDLLGVEVPACYATPGPREAPAAAPGEGQGARPGATAPARAATSSAAARSSTPS